MILLRKASYGVLAATAIFASSCTLKQMVKLAKEQELTVTPSPLELHGDSVKFDMSATLPVKMLKKNKIYTVRTWYEYGDPTVQLNQFKFSDTEFPNQKVEQPSITQNFSFPYAKGMETGEVKIQGVATNLTKSKSEETEELPVAKGLIMTSRSFVPTFSSLYSDHGYNNQEELEPHNVQFFFDQGSSKLRSSEVVGEQGQLLTAFIATKIKTKTVTIYGSHSPEGRESINSDLAEQRATVIREFYQKKMREFDYKGLADEIQFETKAIFQDWDGLRSALGSTSAVDENQKSQILDIVNGAGTFEEKAKAISKLSFYKTVLNKVYPELRISKTQIMSVKPKKTDAEIQVLARGIYESGLSADTLSYEELMYAATLTPLVEEKIKIYQSATKSNDSWKSHNNLGACYVDLAKKASNTTLRNENLTKALAQFELAVNKESNATSLTNLASTLVALEQFDKAKEALAKAKSAQSGGASQAQALAAAHGTYLIRQGDYNNAISNLVKATDVKGASHNLGLAYLLKKDYTKAETTLEKATFEDNNNALSYYLRAVVAARQGNETALGVTLGQATQKDSKLKEKAIGDLEFMNFQNSPSFTNAMK